MRSKYMKIMTVHEITNLFHSHGLKCDEQIVKEWITEGKIKGTGKCAPYTVSEDDVYTFLYDYRWNGTAYERGIDDQTKIDRLQDEIIDLKKQVEKLQQEKSELQGELGIIPF
jgi:predicted RNase H-like nuclease (RuvC/YqgF family)